jgi:pilus assembly protein CpaB
MRRTKTVFVLLILLFLVVLLTAGYFFLSSQTPGGTPGGGIPGVPTVPTVVPKVRILIANQVIPANTVLTVEAVNQFFEAQERERPSDYGESVVGSEKQLVGQVTLVDIQPGVLLYTTQFTPATLAHKIPKGERAVPLKVDQFSGVVGQIAVGNYVDIIFSGQLELHYPQAFPPSLEEPPISLSPPSLLVVKTILQDVQVLDIIPIVTSSASMGQGKAVQPTPSEAAPQPTVQQPTQWILILAVSDQEAEVLRFAQDQQMIYQLLLRAPDDHDLVTTQGVTTKILVETYKVPIPELLRYDIKPGQLPSGIIP